MVVETDDTTQNRHSWFNDAHRLIDDNIRLIKNGMYMVCGIGIVLIGRSIYVTRVFTSAEEIPTKFLQNHFSLLGKAREVTDDGIIKIQHIPPLRNPFRRTDARSLQVKLACLDISPAGRLWLTNSIIDKTVWFRLLHRNVPLLHCSIIIPKMPQSLHVNEELMKQGLCKLSSTESLEKEYFNTIKSDKTFLNYLDRMVYLEGKAFKKETGMWKVHEPLEKTWKSKTVHAVKSVLSSPFRAVYWLYRKVRKRKENG